MASSFFNPKGAATRFLTAICNLIIVNLLFIITSIPVFSLGASLTALYRITIAIVAGDNPAVFREYLKAFKDNFLRSTLLLLLYTALSGFFIFEIYMVRTMMEPQFAWAQYPAYFFLFAIAASSLYSFPLIAWFDTSFKQMLKNSLLLAITNLPITIMYIVITAVMAYLIYEFTIIPLSFMVFMGISILAWFYSLFLKKIFEKNGVTLIPKDDLEKED
ncbi:MAG: DUF624 domain-containing protein [Clostridiales bacterium]|nr:DUF624 domain-containing protein [Clostridiales bacterium]